MRIQLLGAFRVVIGTRVVEAEAWRLRKAASLVKLLALAPGHRLHREQIMNWLWPELDAPAAANSLHQALHSARRALDPDRKLPAADLLRLDQQHVHLQWRGPLLVDVEAFETAAAEARRERDPARYAAAIELYAGDLLPEDRYEDWAISRRETLRELYLLLLLELARLYEGRDEDAPARAALERLVAHEPAHEEGHVALMRLLASAGQRQAALRQYRRLREALRHELDAEPDETSQRLYQDILTGHFRQRPALPPTATIAPHAAPNAAAPAEAPRHNLPVPLTSFIGREAELAAVGDLLATTRLLTLTGPGGSGKTRLALAAAGELVPAFPDGVWLVDLAVVSDAALVPAAVAAALGIREAQHAPLPATLAAALGSRRLLLILDNCEHLVDACARLIHTLMEACHGLQALATSREALRVPGELVRQVPPLALPDPEGLPPSGPELAAALAAVESVRLLVERIRLRRPAFAVTAANAGAVVEICRRLDGVPLALELAAARAAVLSAEQIAERLHGSLWLLTDGSRTAVPRQQTLRATLDWSFRLLSEPEQTLLRRLAVFAGGFGLTAAEVVAGSDEPVDLDHAAAAGAQRPAGEVLDLLARLVDKSLALVEERRYAPHPETRYRLLETVRQYALEQLAAAGELDLARRRHRAFYRDLAEAAAPHLARGDQSPWRRRLELEHDNIRGALQSALDRRDVAISLRLAGAMWQFWYGRGYQAEGRRWLELALALAGDEPGPACTQYFATALNGAGTIAWSQGDNAAAQALLERSLLLQRGIDDRPGIASSLHYLGAVAHHEQDYPRAAALYWESLALRRELHDKRGIAYLLNNLGVLALSQNDLPTAGPLLEESLLLNRELRDDVGSAYTLDSLGQVALGEGDVARAQAYFVASLDLLGAGGDKVCLVASIDGLAEAAVRRGQPARAARLLGASQAIRGTMGARLAPIVQERQRAAVVAIRAQIGEEAYLTAWEAGRAMTIEQAISEARTI